MIRSLLGAAFFVISTTLSVLANHVIPEREKIVHVADSLPVIYKSDNVIITRLSPGVLEHTTFFNTNTFGRVSCNGMIVINKNEAVIFDTPGTNKDAEELLSYLLNTMKIKVKAVIATHFHADCVGGLDTFHKYGIPSYANNKTIEFAKTVKASLPQNGFDKDHTVKLDGKKVYARFFGEGHTKDNIVGYFADDKILFGGCLVKELKADKGNLADANTQAWPQTIQNLKKAYPDVKIVIPGHGTVGGSELLDYTEQLFREK